MPFNCSWGGRVAASVPCVATTCPPAHACTPGEAKASLGQTQKRSRIHLWHRHVLFAHHSNMRGEMSEKLNLITYLAEILITPGWARFASLSH